jgi:hypothetical protein
VFSQRAAQASLREKVTLRSVERLQFIIATAVATALCDVRRENLQSETSHAVPFWPLTTTMSALDEIERTRRSEIESRPDDAAIRGVDAVRKVREVAEMVVSQSPVAKMTPEMDEFEKEEKVTDMRESARTISVSWYR